MTTKEVNKLIALITICLAFLNVSVWWSWATFRRVADDVVKINNSIPVNEGEKNCLASGGIPKYYSGDFINCDSKN